MHHEKPNSIVSRILHLHTVLHACLLCGLLSYLLLPASTGAVLEPGWPARAEDWPQLPTDLRRELVERLLQEKKSPGKFAEVVDVDALEQALASKDYKLTAEVLEKALTREPKPAFSVLHVLLCDAYFSQGMDDQALAECTTALQYGGLGAGNEVLAYFVRGVLYFKQKQFDRAFDDWDTVLWHDPSFVPAYYFRGRIYYHQRRFAEALQDLTNVITLAPASMPPTLMANAYLWRAIVYSDTGNDADATDDLNKAIKLAPPRAVHYSILGRLYLRQGRWQDAIDNLSNAIALDPTRTDDTYKRAGAYSAAGHYLEARKGFETVLAQAPDQAVAYLKQAMVYDSLGDSLNALRAWEAAIALAPNPTFAYVIRAGMMRDQAKHDAHGRPDWDDRASLLAPAQVQVHVAWGAFYEDRDDTVALAELHAALARDPFHVWALYYRAQIYDRQGNRAAALADLDTAISHAPDRGLLYLARGQVYLRQGDAERALADLENAVALIPAAEQASFDRHLIGYSEQAYYWRGHALTKLRQGERALADFTQALTLEPAWAAPYVGRGMVYLHKGDFSRARTEFSQAIALTPERHKAYLAEIYFLRAVTYKHQGAYPQEIDDLQHALEYTTDPEGRRSLASIIDKELRGASFPGSGSGDAVPGATRSEAQKDSLESGDATSPQEDRMEDKPQKAPLNVSEEQGMHPPTGQLDEGTGKGLSSEEERTAQQRWALRCPCKLTLEMLAHIGIHGAPGEDCVMRDTEIHWSNEGKTGFIHVSHSGETMACFLCVPKEHPEAGCSGQIIEEVNPLEAKDLARYGLITPLSSKEYDACRTAVVTAVRVLGIEGCRGK